MSKFLKIIENVYTTLHADADVSEFDRATTIESLEIDDVPEFLVALEEETRVAIPEEEWECFETVGDIAAYLDENLS